MSEWMHESLNFPLQLGEVVKVIRHTPGWGFWPIGSTSRIEAQVLEITELGISQSYRLKGSQDLVPVKCVARWTPGN